MPDTFSRSGNQFTFSSEIVLEADIYTLWDFFSHPKNLEKVNDAKQPVTVELDRSVAVTEGLEFTVSLKILDIIPQKIITKVILVKEPNEFVDIQIKGSFKSWKHCHTFSETSQTQTTVRDEITFQLPLGFIGRILASSFIKKLIFANFETRRKKLSILFN